MFLMRYCHIYVYSPQTIKPGEEQVHERCGTVLNTERLSTAPYLDGDPPLEGGGKSHWMRL